MNLRRSRVELWPTGTRWHFHRIAGGKIADQAQPAGYSRKDSALRGIRRRWPDARIVILAKRPKRR